MKPTVGRTVYYYESAAHRQACDAGTDQPNIAFVTFVHGEDSINIVGFSHHNIPFMHLGVQFQGLGADVPNGAHAAWMPYQVGQAAKNSVTFTPAPGDSDLSKAAPEADPVQASTMDSSAAAPASDPNPTTAPADPAAQA